MMSTDTAGGATGYVPVHDLQTYYEIQGDGDPIAVLHGGLSTLEDFALIAPALAQRRRVIGMERQGHGHTADIDRAFSTEQWADDAAAVMQALNVETADVFGYSVGGTVALQLAIRHPQVVRRLILSSAVYNMDGYLPDIRDGLKAIETDALPPEMREAYSRVAPHPEDWPALVAKAAEQARADSGIPPERIQGINVPALVVVAENDVVRPEHSNELARLLNAELVTLPDVDHASYLREPDPLLAKVEKFLDEPV
jgi:pimeloyl-ACP methyl ester carboxylesterase